MNSETRRSRRKRDKRNRVLFMIGATIIILMFLWALFFDFAHTDKPTLSQDDFFEKPAKP